MGSYRHSRITISRNPEEIFLSIDSPKYVHHSGLHSVVSDHVHALRRGSRRWIRGLLIAFTVLVALIGVGTLGLRALLSKQQALESSSAVHEAGYVQIGEVPQWIEIRGWDRSNPVILWLHGGPGAPVLPASYASFLPWERTFTIVHWHQMAQRRPDLFVAYVGTGQFNSLEDDGRDLFAAAMQRAKADGNASAIASLTSVSSLPFTSVRRMDAVRKWGKSEDVSDNPLLVLIALVHVFHSGEYLSALTSKVRPLAH